jgi:predicted Zn-dependent peptidase
MALRPRFKKTVFDNGLTLLTERHPEFRSLSIGVWVKAGTRHERPREAGLSHFLEHMLFKGTENRSSLEIARAVDQVGGEFNAFTAREHTCFHILLLDRDFGLGLDILSDVILNSNFSPEELERERKVILQEINMVEESPEELVHDLFFELAYGRHGLGKSILGSEASVKRLSRAELLRFFRKHYRPEQTVISVAGNVSHEVVKRRLKPLIQKRWPGRAESRNAGNDRGYVPAPRVRSGRWWIQRPTEQVHLVWGVEGLSYSHRDRFASFLLNTYLGGGMSSALFQEIREKNGLAYTVYSSLSAFSDSGLFSVYSATGMPQIPLCLKLIEECVGNLRKTLLSADDLQIIKDNVKGTILLSSDSVESRMTSIAKSEIYHGQYVPAHEICKRIDEVTPEDVRRVARQLLQGDRRSMVALGGKPSKGLATKLGISLLNR